MITALSSVLRQVVLAALLLAGISALSTTATLADLRGECRKLLWITGGDLRVNSKRFLHEGSLSYFNALMVAVQSASEVAPSVAPAVVLLGVEDETPKWMIAGLRRIGAHVMFHELTFHKELEAAAEHLHVPPEQFNQGTYLRLDLPAIMKKLRRLRVFGFDDIDTEFPLYADPDVIFNQDFDSCVLPKPALVALAADTGHEVASSAAVMHVNVSAFTLTWHDFLCFAVREHFYLPGSNHPESNFAYDQGLLLGYMHQQPTLLAVLPDIYNYKPYWGDVPAPVGWYPASAASGKPAIIHTQGPKVSFARCVFTAARGGNCSREDIKTCDFTAALTACGLGDGRIGFPWLKADLEYAFIKDDGAMYETTFKLRNRYWHGICSKLKGAFLAQDPLSERCAKLSVGGLNRKNIRDNN